MSAKVTYQGEDDGPEEILLHGIRFLVGKAVEVSDDIAIRLMGNPFFEREDPGATDKAVIAEKVAADNAATAADAKTKAKA